MCLSQWWSSMTQVRLLRFVRWSALALTFLSVCALDKEVRPLTLKDGFILMMCLIGQILLGRWSRFSKRQCHWHLTWMKNGEFGITKLVFFLVRLEACVYSWVLTLLYQNRCTGIFGSLAPIIGLATNIPKCYLLTSYIRKCQKPDSCTVCYQMLDRLCR